MDYLLYRAEQEHELRKNDEPPLMDGRTRPGIFIGFSTASLPRPWAGSHDEEF